MSGIRRRATYQRAVADRNRLQIENLQLRTQLSGAEARIDELMLEYCPDEMTEEQQQRWAANQVRVSSEVEAQINEALT